MPQVPASLKLTQLGKLSAEHVLSFIADNYSRHEPLTLHFRLPAQIIAKTMAPRLESCMKSGLSYAYTDGPSIASVFLAEPLPLGGSTLEEADDMRVKWIHQLFAATSREYNCTHPGKTVIMRTSATSPQHWGAGLTARLIAAAEQQAIAQGCREFITFCSNPFSSRMMGKMGYLPVGECRYEEFCHQGQYPFRGIQGAEKAEMLKKIVGADLR